MSKLIEERIREKVRKIAILPENAICMNCTNKSQFVVMQYRIFICNVCVDAHRQCGHKGVQSVSFSTFSKEDLESLLSGGNEVGKRLYLPPNFNDSMKIQAKKYEGNIQGHKDAVVRFIQTMYFEPTEGTTRSEDEIRKIRSEISFGGSNTPNTLPTDLNRSRSRSRGHELPYRDTSTPLTSSLITDSNINTVSGRGKGGDDLLGGFDNLSISADTKTSAYENYNDQLPQYSGYDRQYNTQQTTYQDSHYDNQGYVDPNYGHDQQYYDQHRYDQGYDNQHGGYNNQHYDQHYDNQQYGHYDNQHYDQHYDNGHGGYHQDNHGYHDHHWQQDNYQQQYTQNQPYQQTNTQRVSPQQNTQRISPVHNQQVVPPPQTRNTQPYQQPVQTNTTYQTNQQPNNNQRGTTQTSTQYQSTQYQQHTPQQPYKQPTQQPYQQPVTTNVPPQVRNTQPYQQTNTNYQQNTTQPYQPVQQTTTYQPPSVAPLPVNNTQPSYQQTNQRISPRVTNTQPVQTNTYQQPRPVQTQQPLQNTWPAPQRSNSNPQRPPVQPTTTNQSYTQPKVSPRLNSTQPLPRNTMGNPSVTSDALETVNYGGRLEHISHDEWDKNYKHVGTGATTIDDLRGQANQDQGFRKINPNKVVPMKQSTQWQ